MTAIEYVLTTLLVLAIVAGIQTVGVVLMSAMVVAPAAAAKQWTQRLGVMVVLSAGFGALSGASGAVISSMTTRLPTGPTIVLCASFLVVVSILGAPQSGILWNAVALRRRNRTLKLQSVLTDLYALSGQHDDLKHPHSVAVLQSMSTAPRAIPASLEKLQDRGWVQCTADGQWHLTEAGADKAKSMIEHLGKSS